MNKTGKKLLALVLSLSIVGSMSTALAAETEANNTMDITVLATSDTHGRLLPTDYPTNKDRMDIGLTQIATMVDEVRATEDNVILVDGGDTVQGTALTYYFSYFKPEMNDPMMKMFRLMDYDLFALGNHEFNNDLEILQRQIGYLASPSEGIEHQVPVAAANLVAEGTEWDPWTGTAYITKEFTQGDETVKVGIIGLCTPNIPAWEVASHYEGIEFRDFAPTVEHFMPILREEEGCDVVLVVAHAGVESAITTDISTPADHQDQVRAMINFTDGIDGVVSGHFHATDYREDLLNKNGEIVPVISGGGGEGMAYMKLRYDFDTETVAPVTEENGYRFITDQEGIVPHAEFTAEMQEYADLLQTYLDQPLGTATGDFTNENISMEPTALMDLLHRAQLSAVPAQLSICAPLTSGDEVRAMIPEGEVPFRLLYQLYVYENWLYEVEMTGEQLELWLEHATTQYDSPWSDFFGGGYYTDEIYGLDYEIHYYAEEGNRIHNMTYQGEAVLPTDTFSVVMNNYRFTGGADFMKAAGLTPEDYSITSMYTGETLGNEDGQARNIVAQYIRDQKVIEPTIESTWEFFLTAEDATAAGATVIETAPVATTTATATTYPILVNGEAVAFDAYALQDENGNDTNYLKLRDLAKVLNESGLAFQVTWDETVAITLGEEYTVDGTEMTTPFTGDQTVTNIVATTTVDGTEVEMDTITLTDAEDNGYTYYKLRDLSAALGFDVEWTAESGIMITTK